MVFGALILFGWAQKRPGPRMAGLGTAFLATSVMMCVFFLIQMCRIFNELKIMRDAEAVFSLAQQANLGLNGLKIMRDTEGLASGIHTSQGIALLTCAFFVLGAVFAGLALFKYRYRALWFHRVLVTAGILMLFLFPVGTVLGVLLLVYVSNRRGEFGSAQNENFLAPNSNESSHPHQTN